MITIKRMITLVALTLVSLLPGAKAGTTNSLLFGRTISGSITAAAQTNFYSFSSARNDVVMLSLLRTNGAGTTVFYLYDPLGNLIINSGGNNALVHFPNFRLPL